MAAHGIHRTVSRWLRNWLTGRPQRLCTGKGKIIGYSYIWSATGECPCAPPFIIYLTDLDTDITSNASKFRREHPTLAQSKLREGSNAHLPKLHILYTFAQLSSRSAVTSTYALVISGCSLAVNSIGELMIYLHWIFINASGYI